MYHFDVSDKKSFTFFCSLIYPYGMVIKFLVCTNKKLTNSKRHFLIPGRESLKNDPLISYLNDAAAVRDSTIAVTSWKCWHWIRRSRNRSKVSNYLPQLTNKKSFLILLAVKKKQNSQWTIVHCTLEQSVVWNSGRESFQKRSDLLITASRGVGARPTPVITVGYGQEFAEQMT